MANGVHGANGASGSFGVPPSPHMTGSWPGMAPGAYGSYPGFPPGPDPSSMAPIVTGVPGAVSSSALPKTASIPPTSSMNPPSGPYSGPMSADPHMVDPSHVQPYGAASAAPVGAGQYAMAAGIGLLVAAIIGGGAFLAWRVRSSSVASSSASSPVAVVASSASTGGLAGAEASAVASASVSSATAPSVVAEVTFRVEPADAVIVVDGRELASDVRSVARPMDGKSVFVTARAPGHADATILVDAMTNSPVHLVLKAVDAPSIELEDEPPAPDVAKPSESKPSESKPGVAKSGVAKPESTKADAPRVDPPKETPKSDLPRPKPKSDALPANPY
jgi:hypothetical protein